MNGAYSTTPETIATNSSRPIKPEEQLAGQPGEQVDVQLEHHVHEAFVELRLREHGAGARIDATARLNSSGGRDVGACMLT